MYLTKRKTLLMDDGWLFHKGDFPTDKIVEHMYTYELCKAARGHGPAGVSFDDANWDRVQLPHDYLISGEPNPDENAIKGAYPRPNAWYRRYFRVDGSDRDKRISVLFEGIGTHCIVWLNGHLLHRSFSGYTGFELDITDFLRFDEELNVLSVHVNNHESEGWWYEGAGIYRHVWLTMTGPVSVDSWGTFVKTREMGNRLWNAEIETELRNDLYEDASGTLVSIIRDEDGSEIGRDEAPFTIEARGKALVRQAVLVVNPKLWSLCATHMHMLTTQVLVHGQLNDDYETPFGFRSIRFDPDEGFFLNGQNMKLKGLCIHQDHGGLGSAMPDSVQEFRVRQLKGSGANALRSTHNPASPALLDACDRLGMLVMDENRWLVSSEQRLGELETMIRRGRNHPSIIFWSLFNEDPILQKPAGSRMFKAMSALAHKLDDTRAIIGAPVKNVGDMEYIRSQDVMGFNYNFEMVDLLYKCWHKPHVNTETHQGNYLGGNDGWRLAALRPYVMGIFCWGIETRGETYWPRLYAPWGIMDGLCYPKAHYELYRNSYWAEKPSMKIVTMLNYPRIDKTSPCWLDQANPRYTTHWNWPDRGQQIDVWVYTTASLVELYLNGRSLGLKYSDPFEQVCWQVPYEPGELVAVARVVDGREIMRDILSTTGAASGIRLEMQNETLKADGEDCAIVTAYAVDADGRFVPNADGIEVRYSVNEHGTILSTANNDATDHHILTDPTCRMWNGRTQLIIRSDGGEGDLILHAESESLGSAELKIQRAHRSKRASVPSESSCFVSTLEVGNYFEALDDVCAADQEGQIKWVSKPFNKRLFTDMPMGFNVLPYRLDVVMPDARGSRKLFFEHLVGRVRFQMVSLDRDFRVEQSDDNAQESITLDLSQFNTGERVRLYIATQIDPPSYHGPNPYWRFVGMYGIARWI